MVPTNLTKIFTFNGITTLASRSIDEYQSPGAEIRTRRDKKAVLLIKPPELTTIYK